MGGREDDLELEVSDLRTGQKADIPPAGQRVRAREGADERGRGPAAMGVADAAGTPAAGAAGRTARRHAAHLLASRRARGSAVAGLVLLACAGLLLSLPGPRQALRQVLAGPTPTPTATLAPGADVVYFEHAAPWGRLALDGNPIPLSVLQQGLGLPLPRGRHTLTSEAAPWAPLRCQLSVPARRGDTCPVDNTVHFANAGAARVIDLGATLGTLPDAQWAALTSAVAGAFQTNMATAEVQAGDHYLGPDGAPAVATSPLRASVTLTLNADAARPAPSSAPPQCVTLCDSGISGATDWRYVIAHVVARWQFAAADGATIHPGASADLDVGYLVGATWPGAWSVTLQPIPGDRGQLCGPALQRAVPDGTLPPSAHEWYVYPGPNDVDGCVLVVSPGNGGGGAYGPNATPTPLPADAAIFIIRFGMVLAGNDAAHTAQPQLPIASAHERALAQQWMAQR